MPAEAPSAMFTNRQVVFAEFLSGSLAHETGQVALDVLLKQN